MKNINFKRLMDSKRQQRLKCRILDMETSANMFGDMTEYVDDFFSKYATYPIDWVYDVNHKICVQNNNTHFNGDPNINSNRGIVLNLFGIDELPPYIEFGAINGNFVCLNVNNLKTTKGFPEIVTGNFEIHGFSQRNKLSDTSGFPKRVGGDLILENCPKITTVTTRIGGDFIIVEP